MCIYVCVRIYLVYLFVVFRAWVTLVWFCLRIYIGPVFPSVDVYSLPLLALPSVHSMYLYFFGENCTFFVSFNQFLFTIFSCVPQISSLSFSFFFLFYVFVCVCVCVCVCYNEQIPLHSLRSLRSYIYSSPFFTIHHNRILT